MDGSTIDQASKTALALGPAFAAGFAVQQLVEMFDSVVVWAGKWAHKPRYDSAKESNPNYRPSRSLRILRQDRAVYPQRTVRCAALRYFSVGSNYCVTA